MGDSEHLLYKTISPLADMFLLSNNDTFKEILLYSAAELGIQKKKQHFLVINFINFFFSTPLEQFIMSLFLEVTVNNGMHT